jgi:hypothetical protein
MVSLRMAHGACTGREGPVLCAGNLVRIDLGRNRPPVFLIRKDDHSLIAKHVLFGVELWL